MDITTNRSLRSQNGGKKGVWGWGGVGMHLLLTATYGFSWVYDKSDCAVTDLLNTRRILYPIDPPAAP